MIGLENSVHALVAPSIGLKKTTGLLLPANIVKICTKLKGTEKRSRDFVLGNVYRWFVGLLCEKKTIPTGREGFLNVLMKAGQSLNKEKNSWASVNFVRQSINWKDITKKGTKKICRTSKSYVPNVMRKNILNYETL